MKADRDNSDGEKFVREILFCSGNCSSLSMVWCVASFSGATWSSQPRLRFR